MASFLPVLRYAHAVNVPCVFYPLSGEYLVNGEVYCPDADSAVSLIRRLGRGSGSLLAYFRYREDVATMKEALRSLRV